MPFVIYSLQRLGLFAAALLALWALHLGGWLLVVLAAFLAWAVSYLALAGPRDRAALWVSDRVERRRTGPRFSPALESDAIDEDAEAEGTAPAQRTPSAASRSAAVTATGSGGQADSEQDAVAELEHPGAGEDGPQQQAARSGEDRSAEQPDGKREQQHEE